MDSNEPLAFFVSSLQFQGGLDVELASGQLVLIIGPNNAGKSTMLRELLGALGGSLQDGLVLRSANVRRNGSRGALRDWVDPRPAYKQEYSGGPRERVLLGWGGPIGESDFDTWLKRRLSKPLLSQLHTYVTYRKRMAAVESCKAFDPLDGVPEHPFHFLLKRPELDDRLARLVTDAFGLSIVIDQAAGSEFHGYCVRDRESAPTTNRVDLRYLEWLRSHPRLAGQGDGLKSYVGCLLEVLTTKPFVTIVDEPEVFLHPPQARLLGRTLAGERERGQQLFVATHSADFLRGALEAKPDSVRVIRLSRGDDGPEAASVSPERIAKLWNDPTLQYSNVLDALFHDAVVICEADADCRFYQWVSSPSATKTGDVMFLPTGGKARVASVMASLRALGVPCAAILDADAIRDTQTLSSLVRSAGGDWKSLFPLWREINDASVRLGTTVAKDDLLTQIKKLFAEYDNKFVTDTLVDRVRQLARIESGWSLLKRSGLAALPGGAASRAANELFSKLALLNIFIVPVGELEGFARSISGHGPGWVVAVMERYAPDADELAEARKFVSHALSGIFRKPMSSAGSRDSVQSRNLRLANRSRELVRALRDKVTFSAVMLLGIVVWLVWAAFMFGYQAGHASGHPSAPQSATTASASTPLQPSANSPR
ncbi:AAA family ATPase [Sorangium sp. So ce375]|uniref:ATP-dependent nuclease n=1 Tax=Sorangium sp. So ce375 TaxID=3133306 RepID=UPI003F5C3622